MYLIRVGGPVEEDEVNALSPLTIEVTDVEQAATVLAACCDQSSLIGLLRHLHGLGLTLLSVDLVEPGESVPP